MSPSLLAVRFNTYASLWQEARLWILLLRDDPALHHKIYMPKNTDVVQWVAGYGNDVGQVAGLQLPQLSIPAEKFCQQ